MDKFGTGIGYISGTAYGKDTVSYMNIESRTDKSALVNDIDCGIKRCKIHNDQYGEFIIYDDTTVYRASRRM